MDNYVQHYKDLKGEYMHGEDIYVTSNVMVAETLTSSLRQEPLYTKAEA